MPSPFDDLEVQVGSCRVYVVPTANIVWGLRTPHVQCRTHGTRCSAIRMAEPRLREAAAAKARRLQKQVLPPEEALATAMQIVGLDFEDAQGMRLFDAGETIALIPPMEVCQEEGSFGGWCFHTLPASEWQVVEGLRQGVPDYAQVIRRADLYPRPLEWLPDIPMMLIGRSQRSLASLPQVKAGQAVLPVNPRFLFALAGLVLLNPEEVEALAPVFTGLRVNGEALGAILVDTATQEALCVPASRWESIPADYGWARLDLLWDRPPTWAHIALTPYGERLQVVFQPALPGPVNGSYQLKLRRLAEAFSKRLGGNNSAQPIWRAWAAPEGFHLTDKGWAFFAKVAQSFFAGDRFDGKPDPGKHGEGILDLLPQIPKDA